MTAVERRWAVIHGITLVGAVAWLVWYGRGQWFFGDEWDFLVFRGLTGASRGLLFPHNEHWSTLPILFYRAVFHFAGVRTYWPYLAGLIGLHALTAHLLWRVMRRMNVGAPLATMGAALFAFYGWGYENLLWAFQVGFVGSLTAGLVLVLAIRGQGDRARVVAVACGAVVSLMFSGISVVMVGIVGLVALARWGWKAAVGVVVPPAFVYLAWLELYGKVALQGEQQQLHGGLGDTPRYVVDGLSATLGDPLGSRGLGSVVLVVLVVTAAVRARSWWRDTPEALALALGAPAMFAVIAQGRGRFAIPASSRYLYLAAAMVLPLVVLAVRGLARRRTWILGGVLVGVVVLCVGGAARLRELARSERSRELALRGQITASSKLARSGAKVISDTPDYLYNGALTTRHVVGLDRRGQLPSMQLTEHDRGAALLALQVGVSPPGVDPQLGGALAAVPPGASLRPAGQGCDTFDARGANLAVIGDGLASWSITSSATADLRVFVSVGPAAVGPRLFALRAAETATVRHAFRGAIIVQLPPGPSTICGITWRTP